MPTKKGKSKPAKAKKASNTKRRTRTGAAKGKTTTKKRAGTAAKGGVRKKATGKLRRTEAGPVWIGKSQPISIQTGTPGDQKASGGERVVIL
jgi:hypothetical protein